jgi:transposase InsO family protein
MDERFEKEVEGGTERGRSPSGFPPSGAPRGEGAGLARNEEGLEPGFVNPRVPPAGEAGAAGEHFEDEGDFAEPAWRPPNLAARRRGQRLLKKREEVTEPLSATKKILLLDLWHRSGLPARDFAALTGLSHHTLYVWQAKFKHQGPAGLMDKPRGAPAGSRLPEVTKRAILLMKETHPEWGTQRIADMLLRGPALPASASAVGRVLKEAGYAFEEVPTRRHPDHPREFERTRPGELWQTDLFTFVLKRQNRRVYLVAFMDDHSRYIVGWGLHATASAALVIEVLRSAVAQSRSPGEILTDNGPQYVTWRGRSGFRRELDRLGIRHVVSSPRHPQTLGKIERFWGSLWRECVERAIFLDLADAQRRVGLYIDHHNFQRPHQGIGGLVPADRYFEAAPEVLRTLKERVAANALELARHGLPRPPFYLTGSAGGKNFSVHAEGERVILRREGEGREEVELVGPAINDERTELPPAVTPTVSFANERELHEEVLPPGCSALDGALGLEEEREEVRDDEAGR